MPDFVLNRNYNMRTTAGHIINFKKGVPIFVPPMLVQEAAALGAEPCDGGKVDMLGDEAPAPVVHTLDSRQKLIFMAFEKAIADGERNAFTGQGVPTQKYVESITSFEVTTKERLDMWQKFKEMKSNEAD